MASTVPCGHCEGRGHRDLTQIERETLAAIGGGWATTADIFSRLGVSITALGNRLNAMRALGLVERRSINAASYEWRIQQKKTECTNYSPSWFAGRWQDWHRGHGCNKDDGKPRTAEGEAEISSGGDDR